ncbi:MAG: hypothetical protein V5A88_07925 [Candidatus Thermoplasmatota archaeon]
MRRVYEKGCRWVNKQIGLDREERQDRRSEEYQEFLEKKKELRKAEDRLRESEIADGKSSSRYKKRKKEQEKVEKEFKSAEKRYKRDEFKRTMSFIGMDFTYEEVLVFSIFAAIVSFVLSLFAVGIIAVYFQLSPLEIITYGVPVLSAVPASVLLLMANYPDILEKRMKASTIGKLPEAVNYMTMSMRIKPSLHRAVSFSADNTSGPISYGLNQILWKVYIREKSTLEESFLDFALRWGEWNENLKRSMYSLRASLLEKTEEGYKKSLERANDLMIEGTKKEVEDFTNSLSTPTTILFAIGVLLPLVIGAMLPLMSLTGLDVGSMTATESGTAQENPISLPILVLIMNVICPAGTLLYSYRILGNRPGTRSLPEIESSVNKRLHAMISLSLGVGAALIISLFYSELSFLQPIPILFTVVIPISYYSISTSIRQKKKRARILEIEEEFPDALFQLGSRIAEGTSAERAVLKTAETLEGTKSGDLFRKVVSTLKIKNLSMKEALFGEEGILTDFPSQLVKTTMNTVVEITEKDPEEAGKTIIKIAKYQQDLREMEREVKNQLSKSVEMMKATTLIFAPIIMGIVASLYFMLEDVFAGLGTTEMISPVWFTAVLGVYLIMMAAIITYFTKSIENDLDMIEFKYTLGKTILINITIFSFSFMVGKELIAGM